MTLRRLVAIVGPTATGKSDIALELSSDLGGEIVNGDSRQVYRGMDIGTATPSLEARRKVRHHLYDIADPSENFSLARYVNEARAALEEIWSRGAFAWLVGGTGQYIWALLEAWTVPEVAPDEPLRQSLRDYAGEHGAEALHSRLATVDPVAAERIDPNNVRRVVRALEVYEHTGKPISEWQQKGTPDFEYLLYGVDLPNTELEPRIDARVDAMFANGLVEEVQALLDSGLSPDAPAMSSIGYSETARYLQGENTLQEARDETVRATRRLVRRQRQWFRPDDKRIRWIRGADDLGLEANIFTGACTNTIRGERR